MSVQRRKYDSDFKRNAVLLTEDPDRTVKEIAANLGISKDLLYKRRRELRLKEGLAFPGHGKEALTDIRRQLFSRKSGGNRRKRLNWGSTLLLQDQSEKCCLGGTARIGVAAAETGPDRHVF